MKIKNFMKYFKGVLKYFKISMKFLNISKRNISSCIPKSARKTEPNRKLTNKSNRKHEADELENLINSSEVREGSI